jgi:hypothetical protein
MYGINTCFIRRLSPNFARGLMLALVSGGICAALLLLFVFNPASSIFCAPCPFHRLTGLYCPGCGSLRAVHQLLHGNLAVAFGLNPLLVASLPFFGFWIIFYGMPALRNQPLRSAVIPAFYIRFILLIILLFWILRNITIYPFALLAP